MFPFVLGIYRPTFDCLCERYLTMIPCMLYAEDFDWATAWIDCSQAPSYCVNWLFTSCSTSSTSQRRSLGRLRLGAIADIVAYRRLNLFTVCTHYSCEFFYAGCLYVHLTFDSDWLIYFWAQIDDLSLIFCQCMNPLFKWGSLTFALDTFYRAYHTMYHGGLPCNK